MSYGIFVCIFMGILTDHGGYSVDFLCHMRCIHLVFCCGMLVLIAGGFMDIVVCSYGCYGFMQGMTYI